MKIKTITCHCPDNYGAQLQAYALTRYLREEGHEAEVIDYRPDYMRFCCRQWFWPGLNAKRWGKLVLQAGQRHRAIKRHRAMEPFRTKVLPLTAQTYCSADELKRNPPAADLYIAGSDQIWNTTFRNGKDPAYYLDFGPIDTKRISYAASFATRELVAGTEKFVAEKIGRLDAVSVREQSGLAILKGLGVKGEVVVDPVFLLAREEWDEIAEAPKVVDDYVLVYDFMHSALIRELACKLAKHYGCKICSVGTPRFGYVDHTLLYATSEEFVGLVRGARCVVSNSFHGSAFAMLYGRDFFVVCRQDGLNDRMQDLLSRYGLQSRLYSGGSTMEELTRHIDYVVVDGLLQEDIKKSKDFLQLAVS